MAEKQLMEMTQDEFDRTMKMTGLAGVVVTVGILLAIGYAVFDLLEGPVETQTSFTLIFLAFVLIGVTNLTVILSRQYLQLRKDVWDVLRTVQGEKGGA